jgi:hypothetical protein
MLKKLDDVAVYEDPLGTFWIDREGMLNVITKPVIRTLENTQAFVAPMCHLRRKLKRTVVTWAKFRR